MDLSRGLKHLIGLVVSCYFLFFLSISNKYMKKSSIFATLKADIREMLVTEEISAILGNVEGTREEIEAHHCLDKRDISGDIMGALAYIFILNHTVTNPSPCISTNHKVKIQYLA